MERLEPRVATFDSLTAAQLYAILRLRAAVFVVEQACAYQDLDGRDTEPDARHIWLEDDDRNEVIAYLRVLAEPEGSSIGRVICAPEHRRRGLAAQLMTRALSDAARPVAINAQAHLVRWYRGFGFDVAGEEFLEDGIPHVPMVLR